MGLLRLFLPLSCCMGVWVPFYLPGGQAPSRRFSHGAYLALDGAAVHVTGGTSANASEGPLLDGDVSLTPTTVLAEAGSPPIRSLVSSSSEAPALGLRDATAASLYLASSPSSGGRASLVYGCGEGPEGEVSDASCGLWSRPLDAPMQTPWRLDLGGGEAPGDGAPAGMPPALHPACTAVPLGGESTLGEGFACFGGLSVATGEDLGTLWLALPSWLLRPQQQQMPQPDLAWVSLPDARGPHPRHGAASAYTVRAAIRLDDRASASAGAGGGQDAPMDGLLEHSLWVFGGSSSAGGCSAESREAHGSLLVGIDVWTVESGSTCTFGDLWRYTWTTSAAAVPAQGARGPSPALWEGGGVWQRVTTSVAALSSLPMARGPRVAGGGSSPSDIALRRWVRAREEGALGVACASHLPPFPAGQPRTALAPHARTMANLASVGLNSLLLVGGGVCADKVGLDDAVGACKHLLGLPRAEPVTWSAVLSPIAFLTPPATTGVAAAAAAPASAGAAGAMLVPSQKVGLAWVPHCSSDARTLQGGPLPLPLQKLARLFGAGAEGGGGSSAISGAGKEALQLSPWVALAERELMGSRASEKGAAPLARPRAFPYFLHSSTLTPLPMLALQHGQQQQQAAPWGQLTPAASAAHRALTLALATYSLGSATGEEDWLSWTAALSSAEEGDVASAVGGGRRRA